MQLLLLLTGPSSEARVLKGSGDPGQAPKLLSRDGGIPPNTTGATDRCKSSEELYYKLEQGPPTHNLVAMQRAPSDGGDLFSHRIVGKPGSLGASVSSLTKEVLLAADGGLE